MQTITISLDNGKKKEEYSMSFDAHDYKNFSIPIADAVYAFSLAVLGGDGVKLVAHYLNSSITYLHPTDLKKEEYTASKPCKCNEQNIRTEVDTLDASSQKARWKRIHENNDVKGGW